MLFENFIVFNEILPFRAGPNFGILFRRPVEKLRKILGSSWHDVCCQKVALLFFRKYLSRTGTRAVRDKYYPKKSRRDGLCLGARQIYLFRFFVDAIIFKIIIVPHWVLVSAGQ